MNRGSAMKYSDASTAPGENAEPDTLPQGRAYAVVGPGADVLGDEYICVGGHAHEERDKQKAGYTGGQGRGNGLHGVVAQENAVR